MFAPGGNTDENRPTCFTHRVAGCRFIPMEQGSEARRDSAVPGKTSALCVLPQITKISQRRPGRDGADESRPLALALDPDLTPRPHPTLFTL